MVASEAELRLLSPYKAGENSPNHLLDKTATAAGFKVDAIDVLWDPRGSYVFWSDKQNKRVQSLRLKSDSTTTGRSKRDIDQIQTIVSNALKKLTKIFYIGGSLFVSFLLRLYYAYLFFFGTSIPDKC